MSSKSEILKDYIVSLSESDNFESAKEEWIWTGVSYAPDWDRCPCSQAIKELCYIRNTRNGGETYVGNSCINKFLGIETGNIFQLLKKLMEDNNSVIPVKLINYIYEFGYIYTAEVGFLKSLAKNRKWKLSEKQKSWRDKIVRRVVNQIRV